jgi:hypothetical protein
MSFDIVSTNTKYLHLSQNHCRTYVKDYTENFITITHIEGDCFR